MNFRKTFCFSQKRFLLKKFLTVAFLMRSAASLAAPAPLPQNASAPIHVLASTPLVEDFILQATCASPAFVVDVIVPRGTDPHTYQLSPSDRMRIEKAEVFVNIGQGYEVWQKRAQPHKSALYISVTDKSLRDPHIWQSPALTFASVKKVGDALKAKYPQQAADIDRCVAKADKDIKSTVESLQNLANTVPKEARIIATNHDALGYFAQTFGFKIYSILGLSTEESASPGQMRKIVETVRKQKIKAIFLESASQPALVESVARDAGIKVGGELLVDTLGPKNTPTGTIRGMWEANMKTIVAALK